MILPSIGARVWFRHAHADRNAQPVAAMVVFVHNERLINIGGFDNNGTPFRALSVVLLQDSDPLPPLGYTYCEWPHTTRAAQAKAIEEAGVAAAEAASRLESSAPPVEPVT